MKRKLILSAIALMFVFSSKAQQATTLVVADKRSVTTDDVPFSNGSVISAEIKPTTALGLPDYWNGINLSLSPRSYNAYGYAHQLNFNWNGLYLRRGKDSGWDPWVKVITTSSYDGGVDIDNELRAYGGVLVGKYNTGIYGKGSRLWFCGTHSNVANMYMYKYTTSAPLSELRMNIGGYNRDYNKFVIGIDKVDANSTWTPYFTVVANGRVGIGTTNPQNALDVNGTIRAKEVRVESDWADFVFKADYKLPSLDEVKAHIEEHKHLPGIPSETEVKENGIGLSEITTKLLQKVEELTLYTIQQNERAIEQQKTIEKLEKELNELKNLK